MATYDLIVIGGGIVGLSTAYRFQENMPDARILVIEKESKLAAHQTGNNSGVIHSGIYYKPEGLKAKNCQRGYHQLIEFCQAQDVAYEICGKIIVATDESELPRLENLYERGQQNGLKNLEMIEGGRIQEIEPHCTGIKAIIVPQTGIVDFVGMCAKISSLIRQRGGEIKLGEKVLKLIPDNNKQRVETDKEVYFTNYVVACAGLHSDRLARMTDPALDMRITPFRGEYYELKPEKRHLVKHLIYPVPDPDFPFLGVHFTRMVKGGVEAGPNAVMAFGREAYKKTDVNLADLIETLTWPGFLKVATRYWKMGLGEFYRSWYKPAFVKALQRLIPEIQSEDLVPGGAGIRAQACRRDGALVDDFTIMESDRIIHVCNAPSPAATACLSIGEHIRDVIVRRMNR